MLPELGEWPRESDYEAYISELWEVLGWVESLRAKETELIKMRKTPKCDPEKLEELSYEIQQHRKEIDEWFRTLRQDEYECD